MLVTSNLWMSISLEVSKYVRVNTCTIHFWLNFYVINVIIWVSLNFGKKDIDTDRLCLTDGQQSDLINGSVFLWGTKTWKASMKKLYITKLFSCVQYGNILDIKENTYSISSITERHGIRWYTIHNYYTYLLVLSTINIKLHFTYLLYKLKQFTYQ